MSDIAAKATGRWAQQAICPGEDPPVFFPSQGDLAAKAMRICASFPVRAGFLQYAIVADEWGIWGGLDREQRRVIADKPENSPTMDRVSA